MRWRITVPWQILCLKVSVALLVAGCQDSSEATGSRGAEEPAEALHQPDNGARPCSVEHVKAIPRWHQWSLLDPGSRKTLQCLVTRSSVQQRERLVWHGTARERGLGLFLADQQQDVAALFSYCPLLQDERDTLPYALPVASVGATAVQRQTVSAYLNTLYLEWVGVDMDGDRSRCEDYLGRVPDPEHLVRPWVVRLLRAGGDQYTLSRWQRAVARLPEMEQGVIILLAAGDDLLDAQTSCRNWLRLSPVARDGLLAGALAVLDDPLVWARGERFSAQVSKRARQLASRCTRRSRASSSVPVRP